MTATHGQVGRHRLPVRPAQAQQPGGASTRARIDVENQDFTTILEVTVEDEVGSRAKMFLDTLSKEYINYTLQSEFDINENTLNYIDKQLDRGDRHPGPA